MQADDDTAARYNVAADDENGHSYIMCVDWVTREEAEKIAAYLRETYVGKAYPNGKGHYTMTNVRIVSDGASRVAQHQEREDDGCHRCEICDEPFVEGDPVYWCDDGCIMHALCCGPERESFYNADEAPLSEGEPVPRPLIWTADQSGAMKLATDEVNDVVCVDRFAMIMSAKLKQARQKGRGGWDDPAECTIADLSAMLLEHVAKGDPVDVANFCMMIHQRGGKITAPDTAAIKHVGARLLNGYMNAVAMLGYRDWPMVSDLIEQAQNSFGPITVTAAEKTGEANSP